MSRSGDRGGQNSGGALLGAGILAALCFHANGCSSSTSGSPGATAAELADFEGDTPWVGTITSVITCAGQQSTAEGGCVFNFNVSGDTATLSNGPVNCDTSEGDAGTVDFSYTSFSFTTSDGHNLSGSGTATASLDGVTCTDSATVTAMR
jgi:hypothetical protein